VAKEGRTILFVSHNMVAVQNLCDRSIWLQDGQIMKEGSTSEVVSYYLSKSFKAVTEQAWGNIETAPGNDKVRIHRVSIKPSTGNLQDLITMETPLSVEVEYSNLIPNAILHLSLHVYNEQQLVAFTTISNDMDDDSSDQSLPAGRFLSHCQIPGNLLNEGTHRILLLVLRNTSKIIFRLEDALTFEVLDTSKRPGTWYGREPGVVRPKLVWETNYLD
jgi:lipopolysaccharide transport system ATP-binding protein